VCCAVTQGLSLCLVHTLETSALVSLITSLQTNPSDFCSSPSLKHIFSATTPNM
jgi:hypothetical protein